MNSDGITGGKFSSAILDNEDFSLRMQKRKLFLVALV